MRKCIGVLVFLLLLFSAATALCQGGPAEGTITDEEYGIYRLVVAKLEGRCSVDQETLAGVGIDPGAMSAAGIQIDADIIKDYNEKNIKKRTLAAAFVHAMTPGSGDGLEGRKKATFSRIGFDRQKRRALLIMGITLYYPEDVMNEGKYVLLEKKTEKWTIIHWTSAWKMQLGLIH